VIADSDYTFDPDYVPTKTFYDLMRDGIPQAGGLAQLAAIEQADGPPVPAAIRFGERSS